MRSKGGTGPPSGPPWDTPIAEATFAFVDVEATGLDLRQDRIVEICVELHRGGAQVGGLDTLVNPGRRAGGAEHIHGIGADMLVGAPGFGSIAPELEELLRGAVFVAHGSQWDVAYVEGEMARAGRTVEIPYHLDTLTLARRAFGLQSNRLASLAEALGIEHRRAHRAGDDVRAMREVFWRVVRELLPSTPRDLWHVRVGERAARPEVLEACRKAAGEAPVLVHYRPSGRAAEHFPFMVTGVRTDLDPPRIIGYLVPGRGRRELRCDRILSVESLQDSIKAFAPGFK